MRKTLTIVILFCLSGMGALSSQTAGSVYMPFNPAENVEIKNASEYSFWNTITRDKLQYTILALEKDSQSLSIAQEAYNLTGYQEMEEFKLPLGKINVLTYLKDFIGIDISSSAGIKLVKGKYNDCDVSSKGKISFKKSVKSNYILYFAVKGDKVPFINDAELKVICVFFLADDASILGLTLAKFFTLTNYDGQWLRTSASHWVEIKQNGVFTSQTLLKNRPWTKLTEYIIPKDDSADSPDSQLALGDLKADMRVLAEKEGYYYPATISSVKKNTIFILFAQADFNDFLYIENNTITIDKLRKFNWKQGTVIEAYMEHSDRWVKSTIWELDLEDERAKVFLEDGDIPMWVSFQDCRQ
ncbi:MAG: hypothetical protein JW969_18920 [Spirochaetales bacterium]|nr:hypothetical protein [Spirochaetales bacterium]